MRKHAYLLILGIVASFSLTSNLHAGPLNRAAELEPKEVEQQRAELKKIRLARQANAHGRKSRSEVQENAENHSDKERSKKKNRKERDRNHHSDNNHHGNQYTDFQNKGLNSNKRHKNNRQNDRYRKSYTHYSQHGVHHRNDHSRKYQHGRRDQYRAQKSNYNTRSVLDWQYAGEFQTRRREKSSDIHIEVNGYIDIVELEGLGRGTVIHSAYIETQDGRLKRLPSLEGYVERGDYLRYELRHQKYVRALRLEVASSGRKRAYAKINVGRYRH